MQIKVDLENVFDSYYGDSIASIIKAELESAIRTEVKKTISKTVKEHLEKSKKQLEDAIKDLTPEKLDKLLKNISKL